MDAVLSCFARAGLAVNVPGVSNVLLDDLSRFWAPEAHARTFPPSFGVAESVPPETGQCGASICRTMFSFHGAGRQHMTRAQQWSTVWAAGIVEIPKYSFQIMSQGVGTDHLDLGSGADKGTRHWAELDVLRSRRAQPPPLLAVGAWLSSMCCRLVRRGVGPSRCPCAESLRPRMLWGLLLGCLVVRRRRVMDC